MDIISASLFFLGAIVASFVGVVAGRLHTGQGFLTGRSRCDACGAALTPIALVPVISYAVSAGRARCCGARISLFAPTTEVLLGALFVLSYQTLGLTAALLGVLVSLSLLLALVLYDLAHQILPSVLLYPFVVVALLTSYISASVVNTLALTVCIALLVGSSLALIHLVSGGRAMGLADAPLSFALALLAGPFALSGFIFSFWIGAVVGIAILVRRPRGSRIGVEVPFAPFLAAGFLLAYFTQWNILDISAAIL